MTLLTPPLAETCQMEVGKEAEVEVEEEIHPQLCSSQWPKLQMSNQWENSQKASMMTEPKQKNS
jgi:hypothetical protein